MEYREAIIRLWFGLWLAKSDQGIDGIFSGDAVYIESWGPKYHGLDKICHWFREWNTRGTVLQWDIQQFFHRDDQTVVQWYFRNAMNDGTVEAFDGLSLIRWTEDGKICFLQEFGCNTHRYDPYQNGPEPRFPAQSVMWF